MAEPITNRIEREMFFRTFARAMRPPEAVVQQFVEGLVEQRAPGGAVLFRAGDPSEHIYYVVTGRVELRDPTGLTAPWDLGERAVIGGIDSIRGLPYTRTAVAVQDTLLFRIRFEDYFEILEDNFEFTKAMIRLFYGGVEEFGRSMPTERAHPPADDAPPALGHRLETGATGRLGLVDRVLVLRSAAPFRQISLQVLVRLAQEASERRLFAGEQLFDPRRPNDKLWFVAAGSVLAERADPPLAVRFPAGAMVLPFAVLGQVEPLYRAAAAEPTLVLGLAKEDLWDVMEDHSDVTRALLSYAAGERARLQTTPVDVADAAVAHP